MVAEIVTVVVSPILKVAVSKIASYALKRIKEAKNVEKELKKLSYSLAKMNDVLEKAELLKRESPPSISLWLRKLEDVAYEVVDLLDEHARKATQQNQVSKFVNKLVPFSLSDRIRKIKESLDSIEKDLDYISLLKFTQDPANARHPSPSSLDRLQTSDRLNDVQAIEKSLAVLRSQHRLSGISIVGMPGVGKTAVARSIYQNAMGGVGSYDLVAMVCVSENFNELVILGQMLEFLDGGRMKNIDAVVQKLEKKLKEKSFLLILDDVWDVDTDTWSRFISRLGEVMMKTKNNSSSIVVTTNNQQIASVVEKMKTVPMSRHELGKLSEQECWSIMEKIVSNETGGVPRVLSRTGLDIAEQCGGLALVAFFLGKEMGKNVDEAEWLNLQNNKALNSSHRKSILYELKRTSYDRLPSTLKKCFAYCSVFPKGGPIRKDDLVQLWLAKGYIQQEDEGYQYFSDLVSRYLLEVPEIDEYGDIESCKMHDEVYNLALLVSGNETFIFSGNNSIDKRLAPNVRHLRVLSGTNLKDIPEKAFTRLHSLFLEVDVDFDSKVEDLKHLRSLKVVATRKRKLSDSLIKSKHVKYLDMSKSGIEVKSAVTNFHSLQTLRCMGCKSLKKLSSNALEKLDSLRHIYCNENDMPSSIEKLTSLQTLPLFVVGTRGEGRSIKELKCLNQLRGLKICNLEQVDPFEATEAQLEAKVNLHSLHFVWSGDRAKGHGDEEVLKRLRPNSYLKSLTLENYKGRSFPAWMGDMNNIHLKSLVKLELIRCDKSENIPNVGLLPELKVLTISTMPKVKMMGSKFWDVRSRDRGQAIKLFPALRKLKLYDMENLEEWREADDMVMFPCLEELHINNCPVLQTWQINGSAALLELSKVSIHSCQNLRALPNMLKINLLEIQRCPKLSGFDQTRMAGLNHNSSPC